MFSIIQSHKTQTLLKNLGDAYAQETQKGHSIFDEFVVLVPSMVLGDWLQKAVASEYGISTMITTTFWGQYQWQMIQAVIKVYNQTLTDTGKTKDIVKVPEVAVLSSTVMQWRLFAYLVNQQTAIMADDTHPVHDFLQGVLIKEPEKTDTNITANKNINIHNINKTKTTNKNDLNNIALQNEQRLWQIATQFAKVYNLYLTHRSEWLDTWAKNKPVDIAQMIADKDWLGQQFTAQTDKKKDNSNFNKPTNENEKEKAKQDDKKEEKVKTTPEWLVDNYVELEQVQRFLWQALFAGAYQYRKQIEYNFWQAVTNSNIREKINLPSCLYLFTVQQLPLSELEFLQRLSQYVDIKLFHYNPSQMFWADIVDKRWLANQEIINPSSVYLRDYGHTLLSRLGKQSRETFASLASMSGNEYSEQFVLDWHDEFEEEFADEADSTSLSLLQRLQYDVLMLDDSSTGKQAGQQVVQALQEAEQQQFYAVNNDVQEHKKDNEEDENQGKFVFEDEVNEKEQEQEQEQENERQAAANERFEQQANEHLATHLIDKPIPNNREWQLSYDDSLQIHSCYSLQRQLEVLRERIVHWLNVDVHNPPNDNSYKLKEPSNDKLILVKRQLSDIVVLLPDVDSNDDLIRSVFVEGVGQDGLHLPARITGVVDKLIRQLWQAICGYYRLLGANFARFEASEVIDWLCLPTMCESLGVSYEQMSRGCELLVEAGFIRGFDEQHLQTSLNEHDHDYRFSFAHALDKLTLGLTMPQAEISDCLYPTSEQWQSDTLAEKTLPNSRITLSDAPIIEALCRVYQSLDAFRGEYSLRKRPSDWIQTIEAQIIHPLFRAYDQTREMRAIFKAMNGFRRSLKANDQPNTYYPTLTPQTADSTNKPTFQPADKASIEHADLNLRLAFVLESIEDELDSQQVSAESSGVITFARFGSLRTVPYKLVVMLNMNLSEFPRQDKDDRYNMMQAGVARRGDRSSEDDDNGSFLDALLCAQQGCWMFYNGRSFHDTHEHLPANPVSELLQFLQGEINWQGSAVSDFSDSTTTNADDQPVVTGLVANINQYLPRLIENWLITEHPPLPFSAQLFEYDEHDEHDDSDEYDDSNSAQPNETQVEPMQPVPVTNKIKPPQTENQKLQRLLDRRIDANKLAKQLSRPPIPLWSNVYDALNKKADNDANKNNVDNNGNNALSAPEYGNAIKLLTITEYQDIATLLNGDTDNNSDNNAETVKRLAGNLGIDADILIEELPQHLNIAELNQQIRHPAVRFLRQQQVQVTKDEDEDERQEPLSLTGLTKYQVQDTLLAELTQRNLNLNTSFDAPHQTSSSDDNHLLYSVIMPAGVARKSTLSLERQKLAEQLAEFKEVLQEKGIVLADANFNVDSDTNTDTNTNTNTNADIDINVDVNVSANIENQAELDAYFLTPCYEANKIVSLNVFGRAHEIQLKAQVPFISEGINDVHNSDGRRWIRMVASGCRAKHLVKFWLEHVAWQVIRETTSEQVAQNDGESICHFNKSGEVVKVLKNIQVISLPPITAEQATAELSKWLMYAQISGQLPIVLMADYAFTYLDGYYQHLEQADSTISGKDYNPYNGVMGYQPVFKDYSSWVDMGYGFDTIFDTCSKHAVWQYVLGDNGEGVKAFYQLKPALQTLAMPIFSLMYWSILSGIEVEKKGE